MKRREKGCWALFVVLLAGLGLIVTVFVVLATPRDLSKEPTEKVFADFVCSPIPPSVKDIQVSGGIAFAGGNVVIEFTMDPADRHLLLSRGGFIEKPDPEATEDPLSAEGGSTLHVRSHAGGLDVDRLYFAKKGRRVLFLHEET